MYRYALAVCGLLALWCTMAFAEAEGTARVVPGQPPRLEKAAHQDRDFRQSLVRGPVGRFQAVRMDDRSVLILDTKGAHVWVFGATGSGFHLLYAGQISPGKRAGEIVEGAALRLEKGHQSRSRDEGDH